MAVRGAVEKEKVTKMILDNIKGSFVCGKEIRIPVDGIEIKFTLVAAQDILSPISDIHTEDERGEPLTQTEEVEDFPINKPIELSQKEIDNVNNFMKALGL